MHGAAISLGSHVRCVEHSARRQVRCHGPISWQEWRQAFEFAVGFGSGSIKHKLWPGPLNMTLISL